MFERPHNLESILQRLHDTIQLVETVSDAVPHCATCQDSGYIHYDVPIDDTRFGRLYPCPEPDCPATTRHRRTQAESIMKYSTWEKGDETLTFDSFYTLMEENRIWTGKRGAFAAAAGFAFYDTSYSLAEAARHFTHREWPDADNRSSQSVVLCGDVGQGKTGLAKAAANDLRARNRLVVFVRLLDLIKRVQDAYRDDEGWHGASPEQRKHFFASVPYLILDEFGIKNYTPDRKEIIESIIRERDRRGLPFLITTNQTMEELNQEWDKQIGDIVAKAHWVEIGGVKLRQTARKVERW